MKKSRKFILISVVAIAAVLCAVVGVGAFLWLSATNSPEQLVSCDEMPTTEEVEAAIANNPELVAKLKAEVGEDIMIEPSWNEECSTDTVNKSEIRIYVATEEQRQTANAILEEESFDGVPATAVNV